MFTENLGCLPMQGPNRFSELGFNCQLSSEKVTSNYNDGLLFFLLTCCHHWQKYMQEVLKSAQPVQYPRFSPEDESIFFSFNQNKTKKMVSI